MTDPIRRRRYVKALGAALAVGAAGCSEPSEEGTPPAGGDGQQPEGPVEEQNGNTEQEPGLGPVEENETLPDDPAADNREAAEDDEGGAAGGETGGNATNDTGGSAGGGSGGGAGEGAGGDGAGGGAGGEGGGEGAGA